MENLILENVPLKDFTTLRIGGPAKTFAFVKTPEELIQAIQFAKDKSLPFLVIGNGSNLLVSDEGTNSLIIKNKISGITKKENIVTVKSGTILQSLVNFTIENGLGGMQKLTGIPGTVGGAIYGNAGAYGQTISDYIVEIVAISPSVIPAPIQSSALDKVGASEPESIVPGSRVKPCLPAGRPGMTEKEAGMTKVRMTRESCRFGYRDSIFKKNGFIILEASFRLPGQDATVLAKEAAETLALRIVKYPPALKCPGSFFKNILVENITPQDLSLIPPEKIVYNKIPVGYLLECVGAKGQKIGEIEVSSNHANLFVNLGEGKAADFYQLVSIYARKVKDKFGITLEPEVQFVNLPPLF